MKTFIRFILFPLSFIISVILGGCNETYEEDGNDIMEWSIENLTPENISIKKMGQKDFDISATSQGGDISLICDKPGYFEYISIVDQEGNPLVDAPDYSEGALSSSIRYSCNWCDFVVDKGKIDIEFFHFEDQISPSNIYIFLVCKNYCFNISLSHK